MVLGNVFNFFSSAPDPKADVTEITICPHAEFTVLPCETPLNDNCQTVVQPQGFTSCTGKYSKKYRPKKKSKLDRLIDHEFDELYKNLKQLNEDNNCLQLKKCKKEKFKKQDVKILPDSCRDYHVSVANNGCKNMLDTHNITHQVDYCQQEKEKKSNFGHCLSALGKIRNRFAKDVGKINKDLDIDIEAAATQHLCKKTRFEKVKGNFIKDYNEMDDLDDFVDTKRKNHQPCCDLKQNKCKIKGKFRKRGQQVFKTSKSTNSSNETSRNGKIFNPKQVLQERTPKCCTLKEEDNGNLPQEHSSKVIVNGQNRNENSGDNEQDEYSKIEQILGQNKKFVLKECEFIFKSPVNKDYLIKIRELEEANEHYKSEDGAKNKLMNFICGKNDKTQQPTTSKGKEKCEEKFKKNKIFDSKGKADAGAKDKKKKSMSLDNRNQGTKEKETMRNKIKSLLCEGRQHCDNKSKCKVCCTKLKELCNLPFENGPHTETGNGNKYKPCSRHDQKQTLQNDQRPETIKDKKDMDTIEFCSCNNNKDNKETNTDENNRESEETWTQTEDEFRFLNELGRESFTDDSDTLENKIKKKKFFDAFLQFLESNKEEIRKQYQEYKTNCTVGGESGDSKYVCWQGQSNLGRP